MNRARSGPSALAIIAVAGLLASASACAANARPAQAISADPAPTAVAKRIPNVDTEGVPNVGAEWTPVKAGASELNAGKAALAAFTEQEALAAARADGLAHDFVTQDTTITAQLAFYTNVFGAVRPDGTMVPSVPRQLAWVIEEHDVANGEISRPMLPPGVTRRPMPSGVVCDFYLVLSANDGARLDAFTNCVGPVVP